MDELSSSILRLLVTALSLAIAMPGFWEDDYRLVSLTLALFFLSRIVGMVQDLDEKMFPGFIIVKVIEGIVGVVGTSLCFYYFAILFGNDVITEDILLKYPLFFNGAYPNLLLVLSAVYVTSDFIQCGIAAYKRFVTYRDVLKIINGKGNL